FRSLPGNGRKIAAVEPNTPERPPQSRRLTRALDRVVRVHQMNGRRTQKFLKLTERLCFAPERHGPGVSRCPHHWNAEAKPGQCVAGTGAAADVSRATAQYTGFRSVRSPCAELDDIPASAYFH